MAYYQLSRSDKSTYLARVIWLGLSGSGYLARVIWLGRREIPRPQDVFYTSAAARGEALADASGCAGRETLMCHDAGLSRSLRQVT
jgi:hypothetical protein